MLTYRLHSNATKSAGYFTLSKLKIESNFESEFLTCVRKPTEISCEIFAGKLFVLLYLFLWLHPQSAGCAKGFNYQSTNTKKLKNRSCERPQTRVIMQAFSHSTFEDFY